MRLLCTVTVHVNNNDSLFLVLTAERQRFNTKDGVQELK